MDPEDEKSIQEFIKHPLNATEFDPNDPLFEGLQVLALESDPDLIARTALEYCDEFLKKPGKANIKEAIMSLSEGLRKRGPNKDFHKRLLIQRAKCQLSLQNYGYALADLSEAIALFPEPSMYDMKAGALFAIGRYKELIKMYEAYPNKAELSAETVKIYENSIRGVKMEEEKEAKVEVEKKKKKSEKAQLISALRKKGLKIGERLHNLPQVLDAKITLDASGKLHFPALILYEESMQSDFIKDIPEDSKLGDQIGEILYQGLPWDSAGIYQLGNIEVYFETNMSKPLDPKVKLVETKEKWKKCDLEAKVIDVIKDEHYIIPQMLVFYVIAKGTPFYQAFLTNK
eukprot:TRINITY_DN6428_c0_g4_i2.p1 TRINITY_DN6428_c0_g4~~TRINITY_DN6428_c0_g4_i2.p1  ORF type:complete len:344 (+),score=120.53 TRINITY_DN6428_c0_g4_i2:72-1103(+)